MASLKQMRWQAWCLVVQGMALREGRVLMTKRARALIHGLIELVGLWSETGTTRKCSVVGP